MTLTPVADDSADRSVLRNTRFGRLWIGTTASGFATWALPFVLGIGLLEDRLSAAELGLALAGRTAGFLAAVPVGGVLADRHSRRAVVFWSGALAAAAAPLMAFGIAQSVAVLIGSAVLSGAGQGACRPAFQALVVEVVDPDRRQAANAAMSFSVRAVTLAAPLIIALMATVVSTDGLLVGLGLLWMCAALVPPPGNRPCRDGGAPRLGAIAEFREGLAEARRHPWFLAGLGALTAVIATGYSATGVVLPMVSRDRFDTEFVLAAALTAYTAGALAGALIIGRWRPRAQGWAALTALACYGFAPLALLLPAHWVVIVAAYVVAGLGIELFNVPWFTATQREVDPDKLARVSSLDFMLSYGLAPLGLALIAPAISMFGATAVLLTCAAVCFLAPVAAMFTPSSRDFSTSSVKH